MGKSKLDRDAQLQVILNILAAQDNTDPIESTVDERLLKEIIPDIPPPAAPQPVKEKCPCGRPRRFNQRMCSKCWKTRSSDVRVET